MNIKKKKVLFNFIANVCDICVNVEGFWIFKYVNVYYDTI